MLDKVIDLNELHATVIFDPLNQSNIDQTFTPQRISIITSTKQGNVHINI